VDLAEGDSAETPEENRVVPMLVVILGPQTRLARSLLSSPSWGSETAFVLVARGIEEYEAVKLAQPGATVYRAWEPESPLPEADEAVAVLCCAFGVIHPESVAPSFDLGRAGADFRTLETILRRYSDLPIHLVLISSVLALSPRRGREYYAGSKNVVEALLRHVAERSRTVRLSVFYPGRLVGTRSLRSPASFLHTSYQELAENVVWNVRQTRPREVVRGLDSRLWLAARSVRLLWSALTGRR
jgi:hypothetical protein